MSRVIKNDDGVVVVEGTPAAKLVKDSDKFFASKPPERMAGESISQPKRIDPRAINTRSPFQRKPQSERTDEERRANLEAFDRLSEERKREMTINTREPTPSKKPVEDKARYIGGSKDFNERTGRVEPSKESAIRSGRKREVDELVKQQAEEEGRGRGRGERRQVTPKKRGFTDETIKKFDLGYCLDEWDNFTNAALAKGYDLKYLASTGLTIVKENKQFDRFKGRVMFPIHSMSGRILGFGGRILKADKKAAKYLNSPESDIYHKSKILYGIYQAKKEIAKQDNCYLVEGYTDVISFNQSNIENVVASSGTALTSDQIRLVNRLTKNITVLFDGDAAGIRASIRVIDLILEQGMNVKVVQFPDGEDPDSFAKSHSNSELKAYL